MKIFNINKEYTKTNYNLAAFGCLILMVQFLILIINPFGITSKMIGLYYHEVTISNEQLVDGGVVLKELKPLNDGTLMSTTNDPYILIRTGKYGINRALFMDINVAKTTMPGENFLIYHIGRGYCDSGILNEGNNHAKLYRFYKGEDALRIDITAEARQEILIDSIVINNNSYLTNYFRRRFIQIFVWLVAVVVVIYALLLREKKVKNVDVLTKYRYGILGVAELLTILIDISVGIIIVYKWSNSFAANFAYTLALVGMLLLIVARSMSMSASVLIYIASAVYCIHMLNGDPFIYTIKYATTNPPQALGIVITLLLFSVCRGLAGAYLGDVIFYVIFGIYSMVNVVKVYYQGGLFTRADFSVIGEAIGIADKYISVPLFAGIVILIILIITLCFRFKNHLKTLLTPHFHWYGLVYAAMLVVFYITVRLNVFAPIGVDMNAAYTSAVSKINGFGYGIYGMLEFTGYTIVKAPKDYDKFIQKAMDAYKDTSTYSDTNPDVILILAESACEIEDYPDLKFNQEIMPFLNKYKISNAISPVYGGRTAIAEYESLTGLSVCFEPGDTVPYDEYLKQSGAATGSIVHEFNKAGYFTSAVHCNNEDFYNRAAAYENLGFNDFVSLEDLEDTLFEDEILADDIVKDEVFAREVINVVKSHDDTPNFILGISMGSHGPYMTKYDNTTVKATSSTYTDEELEEAEKYAQALTELDDAIAEIVDFYNNNGRKVLIYVYGDHLPALSMNATAGQLADKWKKYATPVFAYSNFTNVRIADNYISISQIPCEILKKSGIPHSAYFDFIYEIRQKYPVVHREFTPEFDNDPDLYLYHKVTWDLTAGRKYLFK